MARAGQAREEQAFAAEQDALDAADLFDIEVHAAGQGHHAAGIHLQGLAGLELAFDHGAAGVHEHQTITIELLHDEALATKQAGQDLLLEEDADLHAFGRAQEGILLADDRAAVVAQRHRDDGAGVGRGKGGPGLAAGCGIREHGCEQTLAGDQALAGADQLVEKAAARSLGAAVAEHGLHADHRILEHQRAGFGHAALAGVEFDLDELHVFAIDHIIDLVCALRTERGRNQRLRRDVSAQFGHIGDRQPLGETIAPTETAGITLRLGGGSGMFERTHLLAVVAEIPLVHDKALR